MTNNCTSLFYKGIISLYSGKYQLAERYFFQASQITDQFEPEYQRYLSYQGLAQVLGDKKSGIRNCYSEFEEHDTEVLLNKAIAELLLGHRKRSIEAIKEIPATADNKKLTDCYYQLVGKREKPRTSLSNKMFGKMHRKEAHVSDTKTIHDCIRQRIELLYKSDILNLKKNKQFM